MRTIIMLGMALAQPCHAAHVPLGGKLEIEMRSFQPRSPMPLGFIEYLERVLLQSDKRPLFNDQEIMLFDLPVPPDPQTQKAPQ